MSIRFSTVVSFPCCQCGKSVLVDTSRRDLRHSTITCHSCGIENAYPFTWLVRSNGGL